MVPAVNALVLAGILALFTGAVQADTLVIPGTGASQGLLRDLAEAFEQENPETDLEVPPTVGSRGGIRALRAGRTPVARISRPLKDSERQAGVHAVFFAITPVVFITHPTVQGVDNLSADDLIAIYSGQLRNWEAFGGPSRKIYPVTRDSGSVLGAVRAVIPTFPEARLPLAKPVASTIDMVKTVESHPFTIGFSTLNQASAHRVNILRFSGFSATAESLTGSEYPINVTLGLAFKDDSDPLLQRFIDFLFSARAAAIIVDHGALPLAPGTQTLAAGKTTE